MCVCKGLEGGVRRHCNSQISSDVFMNCWYVVTEIYLYLVLYT